MSTTVTHDEDCDCGDSEQITPEELAELVANATPRQLWAGESMALVNIGAGADVCQSGRYLEAVQAEMRKRGIVPHGETPTCPHCGGPRELDDGEWRCATSPHCGNDGS